MNRNRYVISTVRDLRNWVDGVTSGWGERADTDVGTITEALRAGEHPAWGTDWADFLGALPDLTELVSNDSF